MLKRTFIAIVMAAAGAAVTSPAAAAPQDKAVPDLSRALDRVEAVYTRHTREHRMAEIQWNIDRQRYGRRGYGPPRGYEYGPPRAYYRRDYGPPRGYGYRRDYDPWDD